MDCADLHELGYSIASASEMISRHRPPLLCLFPYLYNVTLDGLSKAPGHHGRLFAFFSKRRWVMSWNRIDEDYQCFVYPGTKVIVHCRRHLLGARDIVRDKIAFPLQPPWTSCGHHGKSCSWDRLGYCGRNTCIIYTELTLWFRIRWNRWQRYRRGIFRYGWSAEYLQIVLAISCLTPVLKLTIMSTNTPKFSTAISARQILWSTKAMTIVCMVLCA